MYCGSGPPSTIHAAPFLPSRLISHTIEMNYSVDNETGQNRHSPPVDENTLSGPPPTTWNDFTHATLRRFPGRGTQIEWLEYLGHGEEGIVYKARIGNVEPVAIKVVRISALGSGYLDRYLTLPLVLAHSAAEPTATSPGRIPRCRMAF